MELEERSMASVRVGEQKSIRQILTQEIRIPDGDHFVVDAADYQSGLADAFEAREAFALGLLPLAKCRQLRSGDLWSRRSVAVARPFAEPPDECRASFLTTLCRSKEDFLQNRIAFKGLVREVRGERWLFEIHDVLSASGRSSHKDQPPNQGWTFADQLLR